MPAMDAHITTARLPPLRAQATHATPLGPVLLAAGEGGLAGLWFEGQRHHPGSLDAPEAPRHPVLLATRRALDRFWQGDAQAFDDLPLDLLGTPFQRAVWAALRRIPVGATCSYGELAQQAGRASASRAVGAAVGRNPVSIIVPCHRVLGSDGALTGYAGGVERKQALLQHEAGMAAR